MDAVLPFRQLGGRGVLRGVRREYRAASRRAARTRGFAARLSPGVPLSKERLDHTPPSVSRQRTVPQGVRGSTPGVRMQRLRASRSRGPFSLMSLSDVPSTAPGIRPCVTARVPAPTRPLPRSKGPGPDLLRSPTPPPHRSCAGAPRPSLLSHCFRGLHLQPHSTRNRTSRVRLARMGEPRRRVGSRDPASRGDVLQLHAELQIRAGAVPGDQGVVRRHRSPQDWFPGTDPPPLSDTRTS